MNRLLVWLTCVALASTAFPAGADVEPPNPIRSPGGEPGQDNKDKDAKAASRLDRLRSLTYDRRPSAVLKAWAPPPTRPAPDQEKPDALAVELAALQRNVTVGDWAAVKQYFAGLPEAEGKAGYEQLLRSLQTPHRPDGGNDPTAVIKMRFGERNQLAVADLIGIAAAAPHGLDPATLRSLGGLCNLSVTNGTAVDALVNGLHAEAARPTGAALSRRQAAQVLLAAGQAVHVGTFLPSPDQAKADQDAQALNLLAQHFQGLHARDAKLELLERAWAMTQDVLALPATAERADEQAQALGRAVELAPRLKDTLGQDWLQRSFTDQPERGRQILATLGTLASQGIAARPQDADGRLKALKLQKTAVEALLTAAPERPEEWTPTLSLLAAAWLREAEFSQKFAQGRQPKMLRDRYGRVFFPENFDEPDLERRQDQPRALKTEDVLAARPEAAWVEQVRAELRAKLAIVTCHLFLKAGDEAKAFPFIEQLAAANPREARELAAEFLRVWTQNHDPNAARPDANPYRFLFGFDERAEGIPLTRSKQERNLADLVGWVVRLQKLPIGDPDEALLAKAFTTCHSKAEVFRAEAIEKVFGPLGGLKPKTLAGLIQQMRQNLATVWRKPEVQQDKKTKRKPKDIKQEVLRGYEVARQVVDDGLKKFPDDWSLVLARAAILHDEVSFRAELANSADAAPNRQRALAEFARAADLYARKVETLAEEDQSIQVFQQWLYASLGACDLRLVSDEKVPDLKQAAKIRAALLALPGEAAEKHRAKFAGELFTNLSSANPAVKYRYLKAGFEVVGDHEKATEARRVFDYYKDLVTEVKLETVIDGPTVVGHAQPFGAFVFLRHTADIERESGGFGRYLQNQNTNTNYYYNFGRPTTDYRDRFQSAATEALKEHFEVVSVTFETDKVRSRATPEYGWRITPYAYLLLKPRGPQVDKLPSLRLDLDFLDSSGYAVLPIESPPVALDARQANGNPRPCRKLQVAQTLDERQAAQGKLLVEVKASGLGLVPDLGQVLDFHPDGFAVVKTDDQGVSVAKFDPESDTIAVQSERTWLITLQPQDREAAVTSFRFGTALSPDATATRFRYADADLVPADAEVALGQAHGGSNARWTWWAVAFTVVLLAAAAVLLRRRPRVVAAARWQAPAHLTPFTAIGFLERVHAEATLAPADRAELRQSIGRLEQLHFASEPAEGADARANLRTVVETWAQRTR